MKAKKILALVLTLVMILMSAACTTKIEIMVGDGVVAGGAAGGSSTATPGGSGGTNTPGGSSSNSGTVPDINDSTGGDESSAAAGLSTKEDIVAYYCTAYNKITSDNGQITKTYDYTSNYNNILNINNNSTLEGIAKTLMGQFMVENTEPHGFNIDGVPPVGTTNLNIDPSVIANATCKDMGTYYEVILYSTGTDDNYEVDSQPGSGSAGAFAPLLRAEEVSGAVASAGNLIQFEGLQSRYGTATVTANIDKETGRITDLYFRTPSILHFDQVTAAFVIKVKNCDIGLLFEQRYTIAY